MKKNLVSELICALLLASCSSESGSNSSVKVDPASFNEMVLIEGQTFLMGNVKPADNGEIYPEEGPVHKVELSSFWIDK